MAITYALAHGLRGFGSNNTTLRVRVERAEGNYVWVRTADLRDAGTPLTLDASQVEYLDELDELDGAPVAVEPAPYKALDGAVGEWVGGMYRFYCTLVSWPYSPAARSGAVLA